VLTHESIAVDQPNPDRDVASSRGRVLDLSVVERGTKRPVASVEIKGNRVRVHHSAIVLACLSNWIAIQSDSYADDLKPYPLPTAARARMEELAASSDILILGEMHGTQEVPELVASLLPRLTELG